MNLTQHVATPEQRAAGLEDLPEQERAELQALLTFAVSGPCGLAENPRAAYEAVEARAREIVSRFVLPRIAQALRDAGFAEPGMDDAEVLRACRPEAVGAKAMIGGAPYLMAPLERELMRRGVAPVYALSDRVSEEQAQPDGTVRKVNVFKHVGFLAVPLRPTA